MNLSDFGAFTKDNFNPEGYPLEILGLVSKDRHGKRYLLRCDKCAQDPELFGEGIFSSYDANILKGAVPCGCFKGFKRSEKQWSILFKRILPETFKFINLTKDRKALFECSLHGQIEVGLMNVFHKGHRCRICSKFGPKGDEELIGRFIKSDNFPDGTSFIRSDRKDSKGALVYWDVTCGKCLQEYSSSTSHLNRGKLGCSCSLANQKYSYLISVKHGESFIALKFGISKNPKQRIKQLQSETNYELSFLSIWEFGSSKSCKLAELHCKRTLNSHLGKSDMGSGYTETTSLDNFDLIETTFQSFGGVKIDFSEG